VGTVRDEVSVVGAGALELAVANGTTGKCAAAQAFDGEGVTSKNADGSENTIYEGLLDGNLSAAELQHRISVLYEVEAGLKNQARMWPGQTLRVRGNSCHLRRLRATMKWRLAKKIR
jgi:hypothetical protein